MSRRSRNASNFIITTRISVDLNLLQPDQPFTSYPFAKMFIIQTAEESVKRLGLEYVDIMICDFPEYINDEPVVMSVEEIVWAMNRNCVAMNSVINKGHALHWGMFEWDIFKIRDACAVADKLNLIKQRFLTIESSYPQKCEELGLSVITHSPLNGGMWSAKYMTYPSANSRYFLPCLRNPTPRGSPLTANTRYAMKKLISIASRHMMTVAELAIGYCLSDAKVTSIVMGASRADQIVANLKAVASYNQINHVVKLEIDDIMAAVELPLFVNGLASLSL